MAHLPPRPPPPPARKTLAQAKGEDALRPWNIGFALSGDVEKVGGALCRRDGTPALSLRSPD
jgi:hypothetical protein